MELQIFKNEEFGKLRSVMIDNEPWFVGKDVALALGYIDVNRAVKQHIDKEDLKALSRKGYGDLYPTLWDNRNDFSNKILINESGVYSLIFGSKLESAKQFKRWVTSEVLPNMRRSGCYIDESATTESIDYQSRYGTRRIRKTFNNSKDARKTYEEFSWLSKVEYRAKRITSEDRIKASKIIIDTLEQKIADNVSSMRGSELLATQELISDIHKDLRILSNRRNGGRLAVKTKEIKQLNNYFPSEDDWYLIKKSPFSENYMYTPREDGKGLMKTKAYRTWIQNLSLEKYLPKELDVDFTKPITIWLVYGCMDKFDIVNLHKSIIDQVANYYGFDDFIVTEVQSSLQEYVDSYKDGYIYIAIRNI